MSTTREHESATELLRAPGDFYNSGDGLDVARIVEELDQNGIATLPAIVTTEQLQGMQEAFHKRLQGLRWNDYDGYEKTEPQRLMVEDVLALDPGFLQLAIHPLVKKILKAYLGESFELVEAKGWKSLPTTRDFHGWHGDAWYDQESAQGIPREVKLAIYLTDVKTGAFNYIRGTHRKQHPRPIRTIELGDVPASEIAELTGPAGTAFLFDTSGIHRQGVPILEPRHAVFLNYHDPRVPLQPEDVLFYRYHPLLLNAAFLGGLSAEDQAILGFGNMNNYSPEFVQPDRHPVLHRCFSVALDATLKLNQIADRIKGRWKRLTGN